MKISAPFRFLLGLGLVVGAVFHRPLQGQEPPPVRSDSAVQDSIRARTLADSLAAADTLRAPIPAYRRVSVGDQSHRWNREQLLASGAKTLAELLSAVPGLAEFSAGFFTSPAGLSNGGCLRCVRVFLDGVELSALNPRNGRILDLSELTIWGLDEVVAERGAAEVRVYMRTLSVDRTIPMTRIDYLTGSDQTRTFRGFFGKRYDAGQVLQLAAERTSTLSRSGAGEGDETTVTGRLGIVKENWGIDGFVNRNFSTREELERTDGLPALGRFEGSRTDAYLRLSLGNESSNRWFQAIAASLEVEESTPGTGPAPSSDPNLPPQPPADTTPSEAQYTFAGGLRLPSLDLSGTARFRSSQGVRSNELAISASTNLGNARLSTRLARDTRDSTISIEAAAAFRPLDFIRLNAAVGQISPIGSSGESQLFGYADAGVRVRDLWASAGLVMRDSMTVDPALMFDRSLTARALPSAVGTYGSIAGRLWRSIYVDLRATQWERNDPFRPATDLKSRLFLDSSWLSRFPNGTFHIHAELAMDSRGETTFPSGSAGTVVVPSYTSLSSLVEIRIVSAVITWQSRNLRADEYAQVAGFRMPRRVTLYGIRWFLWN